MAGQTDLLTLGVDFEFSKASQNLKRELEKQRRAEERAAEQARRQQERAEQQQRQRSQAAAEQLIERRRRIAVEAIKDEGKRRRAMIEAEFQEERRLIKRLLDERVQAGDISARKAKQQLANIERDLAAVRDRRLAEVPAQTLQGRLGALTGRLGIGGVAGGAAVGYAVARGLKESIEAAIAFESALVEVRKTTGLAGADLDNLGKGLLALAERTGVAQNDLAAIAGTAGQLGIQGVDNILAFTETVAMFSAVTELSADQSADALAKIGNAFSLPVEQSKNLGSAINELSNTTAARAGDIVQAVSKVGSAGAEVGFAVDEVAAITATLISSGVQVETAGTSMRNVFIRMRTEAEGMAEVAGVSTEQWNQMVREDALGALNAYLDGLRQISPEMAAINIKSVFGDESFLAVSTLARQAENLAKNVHTAGDAFKDGTSLQREFNASLESVSAQWNIFTARLTSAATTLGQAFLPGLMSALKTLNSFGRSAEEVAQDLEGVNSQLSQLGETDRLLDRYADLVRDGKTETDEFRSVVADLNSRMPGFVSQFDEAGEPIRLYADAMRRAVEATRELAVLQQKDLVVDLVEEYREAEAAYETAMARRQRLIQQSQKSQSEREREYRQELTSDRSGRMALSPERMREILDPELLLEQQDATIQQANQSAQRVATLIGSATQGLSDTGVAILEQYAGTTDAILGRIASRLDSAQQRAEAAGSTAPASPTGGATPPTDEDAAEKARRRREQGERAEREIAERTARYRADAETDVFERQLAQIGVRYEAERDEIRRTAEVARKAQPGRAGEIDAAEQAALDASVAAEARARQEVVEKREELERKVLEDIEEMNRRSAEELSKADRKAFEERAEYDREIHEAMLRRRLEAEKRALEEMRRYISQWVDASLDVILAAFEQRQRMSEAEIELQRSQFEEEERALRESLRKREVSAKEFNLRLQVLTERRAEYEKRVEAERASVGEQLLRGLGEVAKAVAMEVIKAELAEAAAIQFKRAIKLIPLPPPFNVAAAAAAAMLAFAAGSKVIEAIGFRRGGYTGPGREDEEAGVVHRGEVVMEAPIVRGQEKQWLQVRRLAQQGISPGEILERAGFSSATAATRAPAMPRISQAAVLGSVATASQAVAEESVRTREAVERRRFDDEQAERRVQREIPPPVLVIGNADARRIDYARQQEDQRVAYRPSRVTRIVRR